MRWPFALLPLLAACAPAPGPADCSLSFSDSGTARVFVVGHRVQLSDAASYDSYEASFRRHADAIRPCLSDQRPNLVVFPEESGLVAWFIGRQGLAGRNAGDVGTAFQFIYAGAMRAADAYSERYPGISSARALTLAVSDVGWRAVDRTFGGLAKDLGAWVVTSADLPISHPSTAEADRVFLDPDGSLPAYVADGPELYNAGLVYGPDGRRVARVNKAYLVDSEEATLDLTNGPLADVRVAELPFAKVGIAISRDAFYPPFQQRLEDLGAELLVQPEAFSGWTQEELPGDWLPEVILASGWTATQKYAGLRHAALPVLTGNVLDVVFDGQAWLTSQATPGGPRAALVGMDPTPGLDLVGRWAFEEDTSGSLDERRARLREAGKALLPHSGKPQAGKTADTVIGADVAFLGDARGPERLVTPTSLAPSVEVAAAPQGHQANPAVAADETGRVYAVWTDTRAGEERTFFAASDDDGATWSAARAVGGEGRQLRPAVAARSGRVVVAWQEPRAGVEQIRLARSTDRGATFSLTWLDVATTSAQWEPALALLADGTAVTAWTDFRAGLTPAVWLRCGSAPPRAVDPSTADLKRVKPSQLQPTLALSSGGLVLAWIDYRGGDWAVYAVAGDLCAASPPAVRVSASSEREVLAADPQLAAAPDGSVVLAWDEIRDRRGRADVAASRLGLTGWSGLQTPARVPQGRFRPSPYFLAGDWQVLQQDQTPGKNGLTVNALNGTAPVRFDDTGSSPNQLWRPRVVVRPGASHGVVVFVDDRSGWRRVRASAVAP